eukprot:scaffold3477_cov40-Tisochrysis_lutea.AAC.1
MENAAAHEADVTKLENAAHEAEHIALAQALINNPSRRQTPNATDNRWKRVKELIMTADKFDKLKKSIENIKAERIVDECVTHAIQNVIKQFEDVVVSQGG